MTIVLTVNKLRKVYGNNPALTAVDDISFELRSGEILGLLGPNGSGKTTTIHMLLGTLSTSSGNITYFGKNFAEHRSEILEKVAFASTYTNLPWNLTIAENLIIFGYLYGISKKESERRFVPFLERFGLYSKRNQRVSTLSTGQLTRVMLVKAFFVEPSVLLLDEPTAALDPDISHDICSFLLEQREKRDIAILISSHKMAEVMELCDRAIFLKEGKIIADDIPSKLAKSIENFRVRFVVIDGMKRLISIAEANHYHYHVEHRFIEVFIDEEKIPAFLHALSAAQINYASIAIEEPSLENYFLHIAKTVKS